MIRDGAVLLRERRVLDVFDEAVTWPPDARVATLHARFADDPALIRRVERLLTAQNDAHLMRTHLPEPHEHAAARPQVAAPERTGVYRLVDELDCLVQRRYIAKMMTTHPNSGNLRPRRAADASRPARNARYFWRDFSSRSVPSTVFVRL